jgi:nitrogen regulatory protein P-II 1
MARVSHFCHVGEKAVLKKIEAYVRQERLEDVRRALVRVGVPAMDAVEVLSHGRQTGIKLAGRYGAHTVDTLTRIRLAFVVGEEEVAKVVEAIRQSAATGTQGDGAIYICPVANIIRISTGEEGEEVLTYEGDIDIQGILLFYQGRT